MPMSRPTPTTARSKLALEELEFFSTEVKILGVYPAHELRIAARRQELGED